MTTIAGARQHRAQQPPTRSVPPLAGIDCLRRRASESLPARVIPATSRGWVCRSHAARRLGDCRDLWNCRAAFRTTARSALPGRRGTADLAIIALTGLNRMARLILGRPRCCAGARVNASVAITAIISERAVELAGIVAIGWPHPLPPSEDVGAEDNGNGNQEDKP